MTNDYCARPLIKPLSKAHQDNQRKEVMFLWKLLNVNNCLPLYQVAFVPLSQAISEENRKKLSDSAAT